MNTTGRAINTRFPYGSTLKGLSLAVCINSLAHSSIGTPPRMHHAEHDVKIPMTKHQIPNNTQYPKPKQNTISQSTNKEAFVKFGLFCVLSGFLCMSVFCVFPHHIPCDVPALTPCRHMVSGLFHRPHRAAFHLSLTVLVHYRS